MARAPSVITLAALVACLVASACAEAPTRPAHPIDADLAAWVATSPESAPESRVLRRAAAASAPRTLAAPPAREHRPQRRGRVDVSFQQADMINAFQFLADAGRFNLVMQDGLSGKISATLRGVDPYDALVSLAEAHGVTVRYDRDIVVVSKR